MERKFKVVRFNGTTMLSLYSPDRFAVEYRKGHRVEAPLGGLLVYDRPARAEVFAWLAAMGSVGQSGSVRILEVFASPEDKIELPPFRAVRTEDIEKAWQGELDSSLGQTWDAGTLAYRSVQVGRVLWEVYPVRVRWSEFAEATVGRVNLKEWHPSFVSTEMLPADGDHPADEAAEFLVIHGKGSARSGTAVCPCPTENGAVLAWSIRSQCWQIHLMRSDTLSDTLHRTVISEHNGKLRRKTDSMPSECFEPWTYRKLGRMHLSEITDIPVRIRSEWHRLPRLADGTEL